jgi:DNA-binding CsgD family transcriptional regulator
MHRDDFFDLIDQLSRADRIDVASNVIQRLLSDWGLHNSAYLGFNMPTPTAERPLLTATYSSEWQKHYAQSSFIDIDPIVRAGFGGILPVDWSEIDRSDPVIRKFFGEAQELDVGSQGLSLPMRGRFSEFALFTVTWDGELQEWRKIKETLLRDLMMIAWNFHAAALRSCGVLVEEKKIRLPPREASCLRWKALGKTDEDIARILMISPYTVRFHLEAARTRLNTTNTTHTVAKSLAMGLINLSYEPSNLMHLAAG